MQPQNLRFGGGAAATLLHPIVAAETVVAIVLILCLPRKYAIAPFLLAIFTIPLGQVLVLGGVHFTIIRILIIAGLARSVISRRSEAASSHGFKHVDRAVILWAAIGVVTVPLQFGQSQALVAALGDGLDALGGYLVVRFLIQDRDDVRLALNVLAVVTVIMGACMINEQLTGRNIFGNLGGVTAVPQVRNGKIRSQGIFDVYIDAGDFGALLVPLLIWMWSEGKSRWAACAGMMGALAMMITSNSSTPLLACAGGLLGLGFWPLRGSMRIVRWALVFTLIGLQLTMKAPVWALIARVDLTGSSSGFHRFMLVDNCIRHFSDWWLIGYKDYGNWGWDMWDLSNQYVACALTGGIVKLGGFIAILSGSFSILGKARKSIAGNLKQEWFLWCAGATLFGNIMAWFGTSYLAQMQTELFVFLAIIAVASCETMRPAAAPVETTAATDPTSILESIGAELPAG